MCKLTYCQRDTLRSFYSVNEGKLFLSRYRWLKERKVNSPAELAVFLRNLFEKILLRDQPTELSKMEYYVDISELLKAELLPRFHEEYLSEKYLNPQAQTTGYGHRIFLRMPFEVCGQLLDSHDAVASNGFCYVSSHELTPVVRTLFRNFLNGQLVGMSAKVLDVFASDERLRLIFEHLHDQYTGHDFLDGGKGNQSRETELTPTNIHEVAKTSFPLCMRELFKHLVQGFHLKHFGRLQFGLFLKGAGFSMDDSLTFWRSIFTNRISESDFEKRYAYNIRHSYGQEGKKADYTPWPCVKIMNTKPTGWR
jgi:DNA primase large subunit